MNNARWSLGCLAFLCVCTVVPVTSVADEAAVRDSIAAYVKAFNTHDAGAVAEFWSENGVSVNEATGDRVEGKKALAEDFGRLFAAESEIRLSSSVDHVRMVTAGVATVTGQAVVALPDAEPSSARYTAVLVKSGKRWLFDSVHETPVTPPETPADALEQLEWLVGRWVDESETVTIETTVKWSVNRSFLIRSFRAAGVAGLQRQGTQIIGWDPRAGHIRSWSFTSDGSFGDGVWTKSGDEWLVKSSQTLADGRAASGTFVMKPQGTDSMTVQLIGHEVEGEPRPASEVVTVRRAAGEAGTGDATQSAAGGQ